MASPAHLAAHRRCNRFRRPLRAPPPRLPTPYFYSRRSSALQVLSITSRTARRHNPVQITTAFDDVDPGDFALVHDDGEEGFGVSPYSSESEWSDEDIVLTAFGDVELPVASKSQGLAEGALTIAAHRFATIDKGHKKTRTQQGLMNNVGLVAFLAMLLFFVDWCSWKIVRLPLDSFYLTRPFLISAVLSALAGFLFAPVADSLKIHHFRRRGKYFPPSSRKPTPAMGGLFFVPVGIFVARREVGYSSNGVNGAAMITLIFAMVGLFDDILSLATDNNRKIPQWIRFLVQIVAGIYFSIWLGSADISTPYSMKFLVPLPPPLGLAFLGKVYLAMAATCSLSMGTAVTLIDGLDGLAGGIAALALIGLSVAALPICSELSVFGASMSGACTGFLFHNRYRASIVMSRVGSFALGGAVAAIAACTGMFLPMLIACSLFFIELLFAVLQVSFRMATNSFHGTKVYPLRIRPSHYYLRLWGIKEPYIVAGAYTISCFLTLLAGYLGLVSA
ncbi:hypothetical protein U9M48_021168 [Paspalum notatum var. saurae]|uniref:Phospho-N-acetylmuramoyl-pentapeptide-transferase n=1 Tax=Paspalum notatum var. saurae TaxID=547442 RepID=A0AAQ3TII9_PASNO